jgi:5-carboxymethyl-2-hydroxymuconate isomerase
MGDVSTNTSTNADRLDEHEARLQALEKEGNLRVLDIADGLKAKDAIESRLLRLEKALEAEMTERSALHSRLEETASADAADRRQLGENLRTAMTLQDELMDVLDRVGRSVAELVQWRDTGAVHKQCRVCEQFLAITLGGHFPRHFSRDGQCVNSGGVANG